MSNRAELLLQARNGTIVYPVQRILAKPSAEELFLQAAPAGDLTVALAFLTQQPASINIIDKREGRSALHCFTVGYLFKKNLNYLPVFKHLSEASANPKIMEKHGKNVAAFIAHKMTKRTSII